MNNSLFRPLNKLERLFLRGFGFSYLSYNELGTALAGLSGTPLRTIVMDEIHSVVSPGKTLNITQLFQIANVSISTWVFSNNIVTEYAGKLSDVLPRLRYLCIDVAGPIDFVSYNAFMLNIMLSKNSHLEDFILNPLTLCKRLPGPVVTDDWTIRALIKLDLSLLIQYLNSSCHMGVEIPLSPSIKRITIRGDLYYFPYSEPLCYHRSNEVESFILVRTPETPDLFPIMVSISLKS